MEPYILKSGTGVTISGFIAYFFRPFDRWLIANLAASAFKTNCSSIRDWEVLEMTCRSLIYDAREAFADLESRSSVPCFVRSRNAGHL